MSILSTIQTGTSFPVAEMSPPDRKHMRPPSDTFEIGLVSAGAISAGAYIAGVMDFLMEALETWQAAKDDPSRKGQVPNHKVLFRVLTGASAGAINAALLATLRDAKFEHLHKDPGPRDPDGTTLNPLFDAWVNQVDIKCLTGTKDLDGDGPVVSLLDSSELEKIGQRALRVASADLKPIQRPYFATPLRVYLTETNLYGTPYKVDFNDDGKAGQCMLNHGDQARWAVRVSGGTAPAPTDPATGLFVDETLLDGLPNSSVDWGNLVQSAIASGAFPIGLAPRQMAGKAGDYTYRITLRDPHDTPAEGSPPRYMAIPPVGAGWPPGPFNVPGWPKQKDFPYATLDGGIIDNDPFGLARDVLAGAYGQNPRGANEACRAVIMVDPFPEAPDHGLRTVDGSAPGDDPEKTGKKPGLLAFAGQLVAALKMQARFRPRDLVLAQMEGIYSRFIIVPRRDHPVKGKYNLACGVFGGFGGFLSRAQRVHDFMLGRRNCQRFLERHFALPANHELFKGWAGADFAKRYEIVEPGSDTVHLPIIPLLRDADGKPAIEAQPEPAWPVGAIQTGDVTDMVMGRLRSVADRLLKDQGMSGVMWWPVRKAVDLLLWWKLKPVIAKKLKDAKTEWDL